VGFIPRTIRDAPPNLHLSSSLALGSWKKGMHVNAKHKMVQIGGPIPWEHTKAIPI